MNDDDDDDRQAIQVHHFFIINALNIRDAYHMKFNQQAITFKCDMMNIRSAGCVCVCVCEWREDKSTSARETIEFGFSGIEKWYLLKQTHPNKVSNTWVLIQSREFDGLIFIPISSKEYVSDEKQLFVSRSNG